MQEDIIQIESNKINHLEDFNLIGIHKSSKFFSICLTQQYNGKTLKYILKDTTTQDEAKILRILKAIGRGCKLDRNAYFYIIEYLIINVSNIIKIIEPDKKIIFKDEYEYIFKGKLSEFKKLIEEYEHYKNKVYNKND